MDEGKLYLGIDYGGNAVKMGLVDSYGNLSGRTSQPTSDLLDKVACRAFAADAAEFVHGLGIYSSELGGVGLAIPGIVNHGTYMTPNVKADWPLLMQCLEQALSKTSIAVLNDANAAALGELWMGAGENARSVLLVTLGSGLGSGLIVEGQVISGGNGAAGEVGHMTVVPGGRSCKCGREGCIERYASARGIVQNFIEAGKSVIFGDMPELLDELKRTFDAKDISEAELLSKYCECELLVMDDVGAGQLTAWKVGTTYKIINRRDNANKPTIITSNLDFDGLATALKVKDNEYDGGRIVSRLKDKNVYVVAFFGEDDRRCEE